MASARVVRRRALFAAFFVLIILSWVMNAVGAERPRTKPRARPTPAASPTLAPIPVAATPLTAPGFTFARDACLAFPPTGPANGATVFLDAGHGGVDPGTGGRTSRHRKVTEAAATLAVVKAATASLRAAGYRVVVSRWIDTTVGVPQKGDLQFGNFTPEGARHDVLARVACANVSGARALVSVHMNAYSSAAAGGGLTIWDPDRSFSAANQRLATLLQDNIMKGLHAAGWAVPDRSTLRDTKNHGTALTARGALYGHEALIGPYSKGWVDHPTTMPGAIIEPLFLTRPAEADIVASAAGQDVLARAITTAIEQLLA